MGLTHQKRSRPFTTEVNKLIFDFVWKYKNPKIKKSTLIKSKENGGLNTIDFTLFDKALKICWVRRLCSEGNQLWKLVPLRYLSDVVLFQCNYDVKHLNSNQKLPTFYKVHLFLSCPIAISFWSDFIDWYQSSFQKIYSLSNKSNNEILYGVPNS